MEPCPDASVWVEWREGSLPAEERCRRALHLAGCADCRAVLASLAAGGPEPVPPSVLRRGILPLGVLGKTAACLVWSWAFLAGEGTWLLLAGGLGDLAWAAYFVVVLRAEARAA